VYKVYKVLLLSGISTWNRYTKSVHYEPRIDPIAKDKRVRGVDPSPPGYYSDQKPEDRT